MDVINADTVLAVVREQSQARSISCQSLGDAQRKYLRIGHGYVQHVMTISMVYKKKLLNSVAVLPYH